MATQIINSDKWMQQVLRAMGIDPTHVGRVVVDAQAGELLQVYVQYYGGPEMLDVQPPSAEFAQVAIIGTPQPTAPEDPTKAWWKRVIKGEAL